MVYPILPGRSSQALSDWMRFKSGLWLGHSRTVRDLSRGHSHIVLAVCFGSLSCWKVNRRPNLRSRTLRSRFSSRTSLYSAKMFPFHNYWGHCAPGNTSSFRNGFISLPWCTVCLATILSQRSPESSLDFMAWFLSWHAVWIMGPYIHRCVAF